MTSCCRLPGVGFSTEGWWDAPRGGMLVAWGRGCWQEASSPLQEGHCYGEAGVLVADGPCSSPARGR